MGIHQIIFVKKIIEEPNQGVGESTYSPDFINIGCKIEISSDNKVVSVQEASRVNRLPELSSTRAWAIGI